MLKFPVSPTVDNKSLNPFLPRPLSEMIKNGIDVPVIIGYNSHEGLILVSGIVYINVISYLLFYNFY